MQEKEKTNTNITQFIGPNGATIKPGSRVRLSWAGEEGEPQRYNRPATVEEFFRIGDMPDIIAEIWVDAAPDAPKGEPVRGFNCLCWAEDLRPIE